MFEKFCDYMYYLLFSPLKKIRKVKNQWYILFQVIGKLFDKNKELLLKGREETMIATCSDIMLSEHAKDRNISRYEKEDYDGFRKRIALYNEVCKMAGSNKGILLAIKAIGYEEPIIMTALEYTGDTSRWAEFYIILTIYLNNEPSIPFDILKKVVRTTKEVGAKDNYCFKYRLTINEKEYKNIKLKSSLKKMVWFFDYVKFDGSWNLDGIKMLNSEMNKYKIKTIVKIVTEAKTFNISIKYSGTFFIDGSWNLNGTKLLNSDLEVL